MAMTPSRAVSEPVPVDLIRAALRGDEEAFEEVIRLYSRRLYVVAYGILQNAAEAEDVVQDSFLAAHKNRWRLRDPAKFPAWLFMVARNKARDLLRKRGRQAAHSAEESPEADLVDTNISAPSEGLESKEKEQLIRLLLASLPEQWRAAITLRYLEGLDHPEIEEELGLSNGALRGVLGRAMGRLRKDAGRRLEEFRN